MKALVATVYAAVGVLHLLPLTGLAGGSALATLYGLPPGSAATELLLRHRAVLFGLLGALLLAAAWRTQWRPLALTAGLVSTASFVVLAWPLDGRPPALVRVAWADAIAIALLLVAALADRTRGRAVAGTRAGLAQP